jgi:hypothetical protein
MKTEFYSLLANEHRAHVIIGNIHRRQFEIDRATFTAGLYKIEEDELFDLLICLSFGMMIAGRPTHDYVSVVSAADYRTLADRGSYKRLGYQLANRVIGVDQLCSYYDMTYPSQRALHEAWKSTPVAA